MTVPIDDKNKQQPGSFQYAAPGMIKKLLMNRFMICADGNLVDDSDISISSITMLMTERS